MKKIIKRILATITNWLEIPGELYLTDRYRYVKGMHVFPSRNIDMLTVGETVSTHNVLINLWAPVVIEDGANLAHNVVLLTGGHEMTDSGMQEKVVPRGGIHVKSGAWIGSNAMVLGGITIGVGSIVGAGSVVTKSIPDYEVWAGNPAVLIKSLRP